MSVEKGDRVKILCTSSASDGTRLESEAVRRKPYWVRAGAGTAGSANAAILGMGIGDRKTVIVAAGGSRDVTLELEVVAIRARACAV